MLVANGRYDGSSVPLVNRFCFLPSLSAGYRLSEEAFHATIEALSQHVKASRVMGV